MELLITPLIMVGLPTILIFFVVRALIRKYHNWQFERLELALQGIAGWIVLSCILPMGKALKGKKFKEIDWEAIKEEFRFAGHGDTSEFLNKMFYREVDAVVKSIRDGSLDQIVYVQSAWIKGNPKDAIPGLVNKITEYVKSDERTEPCGSIRILGEDLHAKVKKALAEHAADQALNEEYEFTQDVEEEYEEYDDYGYSSDDDSDTYVVPVPISGGRSESTVSKPTQQSSFNKPVANTPAKAPPKPEPRKAKRYFVERMGPGQYSYQRLTGGDSNLRNAQRRLEQHQDARYGSDKLAGNASNARYRIVDEEGRVQ